MMFKLLSQRLTGISAKSPCFTKPGVFSAKRCLSQVLPDDFDSSKYSNSVYLVGKTISSPQPITLRDGSEVLGYTFKLKTPGPHKNSKPVYCQVASYKVQNSSLHEYIAGNIKPGQTLKIEGFFRKSVKYQPLPENPIKAYYTIGPKSIEILDENMCDDEMNNE